MKTTTDDKSGHREGNDNPDQMLTAGIGKRIAACADAAGGKRRLAYRAGIHETQLYRYISGKNQPSVEVAAAIAGAVDVRMEWLATGQGPMRDGMRAEPVTHAAIDLDLLEDALEAIDDALERTEHRLTPRQRASLAAALYDTYRHSGKAPAKGAVLRLIESFAKS